MKIILVGLPLFTSYLAKELSAFFPGHRFVALDTYYKTTDKALYLWHLQTADVVHSVNGTLKNSKVLEIALRKNKKVILHWVGTDLQTAKKDFQSGNYNPAFIQKPVHLTDTPWFVEELKKIGIEEGQFIPLKALEEKQARPFPEDFSVLCYIPENRSEFYGMNILIDMALETPEVEYKIAGMKEYQKPLSANIKLLGWVKNMEEEINRSVACLRFPQTDGLSFFVLESLSLFRYVAYNQEFEYSDYCRNTSDFIRWIKEKQALFMQDKLPLNEEAARNVLQDFNKEKVLNQLMEIYRK